MSFIGNSQPKKKNKFVKDAFHDFDKFCELGTVPNPVPVSSRGEIEIIKMYVTLKRFNRKKLLKLSRLPIASRGNP